MVFSYNEMFCSRPYSEQRHDMIGSEAVRYRLTIVSMASFVNIFMSNYSNDFF